MKLYHIVFGAALAIMGAVYTAPMAEAEVVDPKVWADNPELASVSLSPDGQKIAMLRREKRGGQYIVVYYDLNNPAKSLQRLDTGRLVPTSVNWANSEILLVNMYEEAKAGKDIIRVPRMLSFNTTDKTSTPLVDSENKSARTGGSTSAALAAIGRGGMVSLLKKDPAHVMMQYSEDAGAPNYYKVNVYTGSRELVGKGNTRYGDFGFDEDGDLRTGATYEPDGPQIKSLARAKGSENWVEMGALDARKRQRYNLFGFYDMSRPNIALAAMDFPGENYTKIVEQDVNNPSSTKVVFEKAGMDVGWPLTSPRMKDGNRLVGFSYHTKAGVEYEYTDPEIADYYKSIRAAFPEDEAIILDVSDDSKTVLFLVIGPRNPGEYYVIKDGKAAKLASRYPDIPKTALSRQEVYEITARDGRKFPAIVTIPNGKGPHKAIALPHGGPWSRDTYGWDGWTQMLANRGFVVVQPQFRGSTNLGLDHWLAGDKEWGGKMQDDVEDAMDFLSAQGIIDRDRMGIFGWSFGGYTTNVAITRGNDYFKCAVSGAGISDVRQIAGGLSGSRYLREYQKPTIEGMSPIENVDKANMPVLIVHGAKDATVDVRQSRRFVSALKQAGVDVEYIEIRNMYHNPATGTRYKDYMEFYPEMLSFFDKKCGF